MVIDTLILYRFTIQDQRIVSQFNNIAGQSDQALDLLEQLVESRSGKVSPGFLRINGDFAPLRGNPRFERLVNGS